MKILLVNQFFWPDLAATSQLLTDLARHLAANGHEVRVICGANSYAGPENTEQPPVRILRIPNLSFSHGTVQRLCSYVTFLAGALWHGLRMPRQDVALFLTTPPLLGLVGVMLRVLRGNRYYVWEMDIYPDIAVDLGYLRRGSAVTRFIAWAADFSRRQAEGVILLGRCMQRRLLEHGIPAERIHIAENWADGSLFFAPKRTATGPITIVYPGNVGLAHDIETIAGAIRRLRGDSRFRFVFVGGGPSSAQLQKLCDQAAAANVEFLPYCNRQALNEILAEAQVGLVTQKQISLGSLVPSKMYALLAAGLPVLFVGPTEATVAQAVERFQCGWHVNCGDTEHLISVLESMHADRRDLLTRGQRAYDAFRSHYDVEAGVRRISACLGIDQTEGELPERNLRSVAVSKNLS